MKFFNPEKPRGAARAKTKATLTMVNFVDPPTRKYILGTECAAVAKMAMAFYVENKTKLGVHEAIRELKKEPFVKAAKDTTAARQAARRRAHT